ncbi:MAG: hypothetical protein J0G96_05370 [Flavobacteriia bacterium]|nr:hypothetical protein [Flavobacteriia bacterium]OJX36883.1 MAG: hypothetical protein BGO87_13950 [Flavobacteriia bacterium 40-80]
MNELIISTKVFDAFRTDNGIIIKEKARGSVGSGAITALTGIAACLFSILLVWTGFPELIRFRFLNYLDPALWYLGLLGIVGGFIMIIKPLIIPPKTILFDKERKELSTGKKTIAFQDIQHLDYKSKDFIYFHQIKLEFMKKIVPFSLITAPIILKDTTEIDSFMRELKELVHRK